jgi:hypothetical protein
LDLVEELEPLNASEPELDVNSRPDLAPRPFFLAWFVPMCIYVLLIFGSIVRPRLIQNFHFGIFLFSFVFFGNLGAFWMMYQAVRYEKRVSRYVALAFVPLCLFGIPSCGFRFARNFRANKNSFGRLCRKDDDP